MSYCVCVCKLAHTSRDWLPFWRRLWSRGASQGCMGFKCSAVRVSVPVRTAASVNKWSWQTCCDTSLGTDQINYSVSAFIVHPLTKKKSFGEPKLKWVQTQTWIFTVVALLLVLCPSPASQHIKGIKTGRKGHWRPPENRRVNDAHISVCLSMWLEKLNWNLALSPGS